MSPVDRPLPAARPDSRPSSGTTTVLEFPKRIPRWRQIADRLSYDLREACFADGRLPTEEVLARQFGVNRHTIRRAIAALEGRGLVRVEHGRGMFVGRRPVVEVATRSSRHVITATSDGDGLHRRLIRATRGPADERTAKDLGIVAATTIIEIEALSEVDDAPMSFEVHRFRADRLLTLPYAFLLGLSMLDALEAIGINQRSAAITRLSARLPSDSEALYLEQSVGAPVLQVERVHVGAEGSPVHCSTSVFPADRIQVVM